MEIHELLAQYCHALDAKDWPTFRAVFTDHAVIDFTAFGGPTGTVAELEAFLRPVLDGLAGSQHMVSTIRVELDGNRAEARSAAVVPLTTVNADGVESTFISGLWYEDQLARTHDGWRIQSRRQVRGWSSAAI